MQETMPPVPTATANDLRTANPGAIQQAAVEAAGSIPSFGSVVQSTGAAKTGVSSTFDGQRVAVSIGRQGASDIVLDSADTIIDGGTEQSLVGLAGRSSRSRGVFSYTNTSATLAEVAVDWKNDNPTDYLSGGYWLHADGDVAAGIVTGIDAGAFVDGPELSLSNPPNLPVQGTASYRGTAAGLYAAEYGTDSTLSPGSVEVGEFAATATLTADFAARTISGCVGCQGGIAVAGVYQDKATGDVGTFDVLTDYRVSLGTAPIDSGTGTFTSQNVSLSSQVKLFDPVQALLCPL